MPAADPPMPDPEEFPEIKAAALLIAIGSVSFSVLIALIATILAIAD